MYKYQQTITDFINNAITATEQDTEAIDYPLLSHHARIAARTLHVLHTFSKTSLREVLD